MSFVLSGQAAESRSLADEPEVVPMLDSIASEWDKLSRRDLLKRGGISRSLVGQEGLCGGTNEWVIQR